MSEKLTKEHVAALYAERCQIEAWLDPKPDPNQWPPAGWLEHPTAPGHLYRVVTEEKLREELFGSPQKEKYIKQANARLEEIDKTLLPFFFAKPKPEGVQRKTKAGFVVMLKTGIKRALDIAALADVLQKCPEGTEDKLVDWKPSLKLAEYRDLPAKVAKVFSAAIVETPEKPKFEIVKQQEEEGE